MLFINHIIIINHGNASTGIGLSVKSKDIRDMSINDLAIHLGYDLYIEVSPSVSSLLCLYYKPTCFKKLCYFVQGSFKKLCLFCT